MVPPPTTRGWSADTLVKLGHRLEHIPRVSAVKDLDQLEEIVRQYEKDGVPLIIEDWHKTSYWPQDDMFAFEWLLEHGFDTIAVRDCVSLRDKEIPFKEFIEKCRTTPRYAEEGEAERLYGKDALCPREWREWLMDSNLPEYLKPGSSEDVLELLPEPERVETLMCYYGIGDTFTAAHKDLCASAGHNLMCGAENDGSAFWFMTRSSDAVRAASYFQTFGAELDHETRVVTTEEFARAPFMVYVAEQRVGDLVLVPKRSCHQVVNHGGITAKMSWSRMTIEGLSIAFHHELPLYRRACRSETYRVKLLVYRTLLKYTNELEKEQEKLAATYPDDGEDHSMVDLSQEFSRDSSPLTELSSLASSSDGVLLVPPTISPEHGTLIMDVRTLLNVYDKILKEEYAGDAKYEMHRRRSLSSCDPVKEGLYHDGLTCDFCGADIFQSFFECRSGTCQNDEGDNITLCPGCYVEGRECRCGVMTPVQQFPMDVLFEARNNAQKLLNFKGYGRDVIKVAELSQQNISLIVDHPAIFASACQLLCIRSAARAKQATLSCRNWREPSHKVPTAGALHCRKCHGSRCFRHILATGFYVADALKLYQSDTAHLTWHAGHVGGMKRLTAEMPALQVAEQTGGPCNMSLNLVLHAQRFTSCRPMSGKVKPGWYDDASSFELEEEHEPEFVAEGFSGAVLGEMDDVVDDDESMSEISSNESHSPEYKPSFCKSSPKVIIRISKSALSTLPDRRTRSDVSKEVPYILVNTLTPEEKEKYHPSNLRSPTQLAPGTDSATSIDLPSRGAVLR